MRSDDVLHSFFIPAFRCKTDVVPGRVQTMWFQAILEGEFDVYCAEYCGEKHSGMLSTVTVHKQEEFDKWLVEANKPPVDPVKHGVWLYNRVGCKGCHSLEEGKVVVGPSFSKSFGTEAKMSNGTTVKVDERYIEESILEPQNLKRAGFENASQMQSFQGKLKTEQIQALIAMIKSLKDGGPPPTEK